MPLQNVRFIARQETDESQDDVIWTFGCDGALISSGLLGALIDHFGVAIGATGSNLGASLPTALEFYVAEALPATGGAAHAVVAIDPVVTGSGGAGGPAEVAMAISRMITSPRGPAPAGRLYLGPFSATNIDSTRPDATLATRCRDFLVEMHQAFESEALNPVVIRGNGTPGATGVSIVEYRSDDAWDTQRRRGWNPTATVTSTP